MINISQPSLASEELTRFAGVLRSNLIGKGCAVLAGRRDTVVSAYAKRTFQTGRISRPTSQERIWQT
jgi:hypothetical protein